MTRGWKRFLLIRLPLAIVGLGVACQLAALVLASVPMRRNQIDEFALAALHDPKPHRIVLLGDSIIRDATRQYAAGPASEVLNLATQGFVGLPGDLFLLKRYLETHRPPQYVVIAAAPDDYAVMTDPRMVHYYMWNTFSRPDEHAFLKTYMPTVDARENYPAAMDLQERIVERLITLVKRDPAHFDAPPPLPDLAAPVEPPSDNLASVESVTQRMDSHHLTLAPLYAASITGMCQLGRQYGFVLTIVWAPMPPLLAQQRVHSGQLPALDDRLNQIFTANGCQAEPIFNMNDVQTFTNFDSGAFHLRGSGWQQRAAAILNHYLQALPDRSETHPYADGQASANASWRTGL